ncbi:MAG TPA: hypothetical protein V6C89_20715 [Drouetiella sp.]
MNRNFSNLVLSALVYTSLLSSNLLAFAADSGSAKRDQGIQAFEGKRYHEAEDLFSAAVAASPSDQKAHLMLARTYEMLLDSKSALREYDNCVKVNPFSPLGRSAKAESLNMAGHSASQAARPVDDVKTVTSTVDRINQQANELKTLYGHNSSYSAAATIGTMSSGSINQYPGRNNTQIGAAAFGNQPTSQIDRSQMYRQRRPGSLNASQNWNNSNYYASTSYGALYPNNGMNNGQNSPYNSTYGQSSNNASYSPYNTANNAYNPYNQNTGSANYNPGSSASIKASTNGGAFSQSANGLVYNPNNNSITYNSTSSSTYNSNAPYNQNVNSTAFNQASTPYNINSSDAASNYATSSSKLWGTGNNIAASSPAQTAMLQMQMRRRSYTPNTSQLSAYNYTATGAADAQVQAMRRQQADAQSALYAQDSANNLERLMGERSSSGSPRLRALGTNLFVRYYGNHDQDGSEVSTPPADPVQELKAREMSLTDMSNQAMHKH